MNKLISPFQIKGNKVKSFKLEQIANNDSKEVTIELGADYEITELIELDEVIRATLILQIKLVGETETLNKVFAIDLEMLGFFECDRNAIAKEKYIEMLKINGVSTLMQLSRAYVTSTTALSGFAPPINFPMVNVVELNKLKDKNENNN